MSAEFTDGGGTAFPGLHEIGDVAYTTGGLTKREWFAGQALAGLLAGWSPTERIDEGVAAEMAVYAAEALMKELQK